MTIARGASGWIGVVVSAFVGVALACNAPIRNGVASPTATPTMVPTSTPTKQGPPATIGSPETIPAALDATKAATVTKSPRATTTSPQPTLARTAVPSPTAIPTPEPRPTRTAVPSATVTPENTGPLSFSYAITWRLRSDAPFVAVASVTIVAEGGGGGYRYFRDDLPVAGPTFEYEWAACQGNPGSLRVDARDGQSKRIDYFEQPPCPTPTPTVKP